MDNSVHGRRACHVDGNLLCLNCTLPLAEPRQALCGDRVCCDCYSSWHTSGTEETSCSRCGSPVKTNECFRDRAAEGELRRATFQCIYHGCPWSGSNTHCRHGANVAPRSFSSSGHEHIDVQLHLGNNIKCAVEPTEGNT